MVVIAIGAAIASIAIPSYLEYVQKSKIAEGYIMLQKMTHGVYANFGQTPQVLVNGETYFGESRFPTGNINLLSQAVRVEGTRYRTYAPLPNTKNNDFRVRKDDVCLDPDHTLKQCGAIYIKNQDYLESMGFTLIEVRGVDLYSTNKSYFLPTISSHAELANLLIADGLPAAHSVRNKFGSDIFQSSLLTVIADLDGDGFSSVNNSDYLNAGRYSAQFSRHVDNLTYISRALYIDQNTGELKSTPGLIKENLGE